MFILNINPANNYSNQHIYFGNTSNFRTVKKIRLNAEQMNKINEISRSFDKVSVFFNSFAERAKKMLRGKQVEINWENFPLIAADAKDNNWLSSEHYLAPFIHEFAHNLHYHKLYSKYGCPEPNQGYVFNPAVDYLLNKLNEPIAQNNPFVPTSLAIFINDNVGKYAASSLPETFAEIFTQKIVKNLDLFNLKLIRNPFENSSKNNTLDRILEEIWEGLIGDNQGLIR